MLISLKQTIDFWVMKMGHFDKWLFNAGLWFKLYTAKPVLKALMRQVLCILNGGPTIRLHKAKWDQTVLYTTMPC